MRFCQSPSLTIGILARRNSGSGESGISGLLIITRKPMRFWYRRARSNVNFQCSHRSSRPGRCCTSFQFTRRYSFEPRRQLHQVLDRLRLRLAVFSRRANFVADVGDESHPVVRHELAGRRERHDHVPTRIVVGGKRSLIEAIERREGRCRNRTCQNCEWELAPAGNRLRVRQPA